MARLRPRSSPPIRNYNRRISERRLPMRRRWRVSASSRFPPLRLNENKARREPRVPGQIVAAGRGHDVLTIADQQMSGAEDERVYEICRSERRMLVTLDHDFGQTIRFPPESTAGIAILECKGRLSPSMSWRG